MSGGKSTIFQNFHANYPRCLESRNALLFGKAPQYTGNWGGHGSYYNRLKINNPDWLTLPEILRNNGYWVGGVGKVFHGSHYQSVEWDYYPFPNDTDPVRYPYIWTDVKFYDYKTFTTIKYMKWNNNDEFWVRNMVKPVLNGQIPTDDKPWALFLGFSKPHTPYYCPLEHISNNLPPYYNSEIPINDIMDLSSIAQNTIVNSGSGDNRFDKVYKYPLSEINYHLTFQGYKACVTFIDQMFNNTIQELKNGPYFDNTIILFTSDHGYSLGEKKIFGKTFPWSRQSKIPLFIQLPESLYPNYIPNNEIETYGSLIDLYPTILELLNITAPLDLVLNGRSLKKYIFNEINDNREQPIVTMTNAGDVGNLVDTVFWRGWHWIRWRNSTGDAYELYYLNNDKDEINNLALARPDKVSEIKSIFLDVLINQWNATWI